MRRSGSCNHFSHRAQVVKPAVVAAAESEPGDVEEADLVATMEVHAV